MSFDRLFDPNAIAVIGASADLSRISGQPIVALKGAGFKKPIYLVNPKYTELHGLKCYPSAAAIGQPVDLALIAVPAPGVADAIRDCGKAGIPFAIVLTAGFREGGAGRPQARGRLAAGRAREQRARHRPQLPGRAVGAVADVVRVRQRQPGDGAARRPGVVRVPVGRLRLRRRQPGRGAGARLPPRRLDGQRDRHHHAGAAVRRSSTTPAPHWPSPTWRARRTRGSLLDLGRKSLETGKPVLIWKGAQTETGTKAAASHTANMTGNYDLYRAAFRQSGLIEVQDVEEIVDVAKLALQGRLPKGRNIGVLSISGGSGIVFADRAVKDGLTLPSFSQRSVDALKAIIPSFGAADNPADTTAGVFNDPGLFTKTLDIMLDDPAIDQLSILLASAGGKAVAHLRRRRSPRRRPRPTSRCTSPGRAGATSPRRPGSCFTTPASRSWRRRSASRTRPPCSPASPRTAAGCCRA